ncbi:CBS domain-containing protein [Thioalkalivibrio sp. XN8]|nr:CBS domain-containing protein [Thioalkalivibrio sp. XN8]
MVAITQLMSASPVTVGPDDTLATVREIFHHLKFHHLPVVEHHALIGVVSDRDLLKALSPHLGSAAETTRDLATLKKRVHQVMRRELVTLPATAVLMDAVRVFNREGVSCIPIVDEQGRPLGILTWRDVMRALEQ